MGRVLVRGVLPAVAAGVVLFILVMTACGFVQGELVLAQATKFAALEKALNFAFIGFLFVMATGTAPNMAMKALGVRNAAAYLLNGAVSGVVAERCYFLENDVWDTWDFSTPHFAVILTGAVHDFPAFLSGMARMLPEAAIPVAVGLISAGSYWLLFARRNARRAAAPPAPDQPELFVPRR